MVINFENIDFMSVVYLWFDVMKPSNWEVRDFDEDMEADLVFCVRPAREFM